MPTSLSAATGLLATGRRSGPSRHTSDGQSRHRYIEGCNDAVQRLVLEASRGVVASNKDGSLLQGEPVGVRPTSEDGVWHVSYGQRQAATIDQRWHIDRSG